MPSSTNPRVESRSRLIHPASRIAVHGPESLDVPPNTSPHEGKLVALLQREEGEFSGARRPVTSLRSLTPWARLLHPFPSVVVSATGVGFALLASTNLPSPIELLRLIALFFTSQLAIGAFNDYCDAELDATSKAHKPIPSGAVPRPAALGITCLFAACALALGASYGAATFLFTVLATAAGLLYDFPFKRTAWSWLPYVLGVPLLPLWAWSAVRVLPTAAGWAYPIGALLALALHLANALPDDAGDRASGSRGLVQEIGHSRAVWMLRAAFLAGLGLAAFAIASNGGAFSYVAALGGSVLGGVGVLKSTSQSPGGGGFELLAVGSGLLAVGVAAALTA